MKSQAYNYLQDPFTPVENIPEYSLFVPKVIQFPYSPG